MDDIAAAIRYAAKFSNSLLAERYIQGREITVAILDQTPLPVLEIETEDGFYDYVHKYTKGKTNYICPADIPEDIAEFTQNMALSAYNAIGCKGFARVDFILNEEGQPYCLEINTIPGFTTSSLVPMAAKVNGIDFPELCEKFFLGPHKHGAAVVHSRNNHLNRCCQSGGGISAQAVTEQQFIIT